MSRKLRGPRPAALLASGGLALLLLALLGTGLVLPATAAAGTGTSPAVMSDAPSNSPGPDTGSALVQLNGDPLATYVRTRPAPGKKIDFSSNTVRAYRAQLAALRNDFKAWLRANAPHAQVTGEFDISLNAVAVRLNGTSLATIAGAPQVQRAEYQGLYAPTADSSVDPDLAIIHAIDPLGNRTVGTGEGIKVAVVDTGIEATHPCFSDVGYPAQTQLGDRRLTNNKLIAARVFNNKTPSLGFTPEAIQSHGTHVAGTVACNAGTAAVLNGVAIPHPISGVAPRALLGNYNVFPGDVLNARLEDILNALEAAYADGFDVANMSLGGSTNGIQDLLTIAVDNLDQANMVVAVAAGNAGPGHFTVGSPGSARRALTAGASTAPHFVGAPVTVNGATFGAAAGQFVTVSADLTAPLGVVIGTTNGLSTACSALPGGSLIVKIALISRGTCTFSTKIRDAQNAGAAAVLVVNNVLGDPIAMAQDGTPNQPTIRAYMVDEAVAGVTLRQSNGLPVTIGANKQYFVTTNGDIMAAFSSQGPTDVDFRVKPDVVAPGVNVLSSIPHTACSAPPCWAFFQGTSMATPHLAGTAAVVRAQHPDWTAAEVRSAVVNTADQGVLKDSATGKPLSDVNIIGAGRENLLATVGAKVALDPVSISFGAVPSGSGQTRTFDVTLTNLASSTATFLASVGAGDSSVAYSVSAGTVTLGPGASGAIRITMTAVMGAVPGDHQALLTISSGGTTVAHAAVYTLIK